MQYELSDRTTDEFHYPLVLQVVTYCVRFNAIFVMDTCPFLII